MTEIDQAIFNLEKAAMTGDRMAILRVVSILRSYRQEAARLRSQRYADGECDAVALTKFFDAVQFTEENT